MDLLIGTKNNFKIAEMLRYVEDFPGIVLHYMDEVSQPIQVEEDGKTLLENAEKKGRLLSKATDLYVLTSDVGVDIPGLGEKWDILKNQRTVGENKNDHEKVKTLIALMGGLKGENRRCETHIALALAKSGQIVWSAEKIYSSGYILDKVEKGEIPPSTWIGHVYYYPNLGKTQNQMTPEEKEKVGLNQKMKEDLQRTMQIILDRSAKQ